MPADHRISFEFSPKRLRVMANGKTVADSLCAGILLETGSMPVFSLDRLVTKRTGKVGDSSLLAGRTGRCPGKRAVRWTNGFVSLGITRAICGR